MNKRTAVVRREGGVGDIVVIFMVKYARFAICFGRGMNLSQER